ncbi:pseudaminic acid cytidylyltransferase [Chryseolinea sp. H1M3-3]|uniref:pseudaminic acid cytidylyltransferase n=1 Tax=Chryseolinea sp. H1M3-3 TaxID=3034144 RepID=UPI0023ECA8C4|nr:pseudaminic acid cytidylyltransferase [Chryseolinea sp. H1M3-3]
MKNLGIIPARGGSKRIPRKNIKEFQGKPVIAYSIEAALNSNLFSEVMVSTEDKDIAEISIMYGAKVPFFRSEKNADDFAGSGDVVFEVLRQYEKIGQVFDNCCCIYATAPLISKNRLTEGYKLLIESNFDVVFPVGRYSSPIWRSYKMNEVGRVEMNFPEHEKIRSQDLPISYYDAGQFYWFRINDFLALENKNTFGVSKGAILLPDYEVQDIDNLDDWHLAEVKFSYSNNIEK